MTAQIIQFAPYAEAKRLREEPSAWSEVFAAMMLAAVVPFLLSDKGDDK